MATTAIESSPKKMSGMQECYGSSKTAAAAAAVAVVAPPTPPLSPKTPGKTLLCRAHSDDFGRKLLPRLVLSDNLYIPNQQEQPDQQQHEETQPTSHLLNLPTELLSIIFTSIPDVPSQIALALTCKRLAQIASSHPLNLSQYSAKYAGYLPRSIFDVPDLMRSLKPWLPPHLRMCDHCLTARPFSPEYWIGIEGCDSTNNFWKTKTGWSFSDASWHQQSHDVCPMCHVSCSLSDYVDCDGCRALGRLGDVDWSRVSDSWKRSREEGFPYNQWELN